MAITPEARERLSRLVTGHILTQCLYCVAKLRVVDAMAPGEGIDVDELARRVGADGDALHRVLRALAAEGLFTEIAPKRYATTDLGELLRDGDGSMRYGALLHGGQTMPLFVDMLETVRTGVPVPIRRGRTRWDDFAADPEQAEIFNRAMHGRAARLVPALWELDWSGVQVVVDVGGGTGGVLLPLLEREPHLRGVLFDLEHVAADARTVVGDRCVVESGSFFEAVPRGGDVYVLSNILHDWNDDDARRILETCRQAMEPAARLVVLEDLVPDGADPHPVKIIDLQMLVALGGRERTEDEFGTLLRSAGFDVDRIAGDGPVAIVARPV